jgi:hypothetical protein
MRCHHSLYYIFVNWMWIIEQDGLSLFHNIVSSILCILFLNTKLVSIASNRQFFSQYGINIVLFENCKSHIFHFTDFRVVCPVECSFMLCIKHPNHIKRKREVTLCENEREEWMWSLFKGETSFYNRTNVQDEMISKTRSPWLYMR